MRSSRARIPRAALILALVLSIRPSCGGGGGGGGGITDTFDRKAMLTNVANAMVVPAYQDFLAKAQALATAAEAYSDEMAANGPNTATLRTAAQQAWRNAMLSWSAAELFSFGPAGDSDSVIGGEDMRDYIYCWNFTNFCAIDTAIAADTFAAPGYFTNPATPVTAFGLVAIEYLLFHSGPDDSCNPDAAGWGSLTQDQKDDRRALYASLASDFLVVRAQGLVDAWIGAGNFLNKVINAGTVAPYASAHQAVNELFGALFYLDLFCKDKKVSHPAGINDGSPDVNLVESPWADTSIPQLIKNVETFEIVFLGNRPADPAQIGFDDFLVARGAPALAATMTADIAAARIAVQNIQGATLKDAINDIPAGANATVLNAHAKLKAVTDNLKSQFVTVLNLSIPQTGAGDND